MVEDPLEAGRLGHRPVENAGTDTISDQFAHLHVVASMWCLVALELSGEWELATPHDRRGGSGQRVVKMVA